MNEARANRILAALKEQGVDQMLITDPMSICYLTGISMAPIERFYCESFLYLTVDVCTAFKS